jgi:hypothetical protein
MSIEDSTVRPISASPAAAAPTERAGGIGLARRSGGGSSAADFQAALGITDEAPSWLPSSPPMNVPPRPDRMLPPQLELSGAESDVLYQIRAVVTAAADSGPRPSPSPAARSAASAFRSATQSYAAAYFSAGSEIAGRGERLEVSA